MSIELTASERIARIRSDFRMGVAVGFRSGLEKWLVASSETITLSRFNGMRKLGPLELAITDWRAQTLSTWATDGDIARLAIPDDKDLDWVHSVCDPSDDFNTPLKGPFTPIFGGSADVSRTALAICKTAHLIPSAVMVNITDQDIVGLDFIDLEQILSLILNPSNQLIEVSAANVPLQVAEASRVHVFRPQDGGEEHYAIEIGNPDRNKSVLSRLHSACFTGDLIGSLKCDCGHQLQAALEAISVRWIWCFIIYEPRRSWYRSCKQNACICASKPRV